MKGFEFEVKTFLMFDASYFESFLIKQVKHQALEIKGEKWGFFSSMDKKICHLCGSELL